MSSQPTLDAETKQELSDGDEVSNLTESRGWGIIKGKLDARILDLQNINNLDGDKPETLSIQLAARKMASELLFAWLTIDVYGFAEQQRINSQSLIDKEDVGFIGREG